MSTIFTAKCNTHFFLKICLLTYKILMAWGWPLVVEMCRRTSTWYNKIVVLMIIDNYFTIKPTFLETVGLQSQNMNPDYYDYQWLWLCNGKWQDLGEQWTRKACGSGIGLVYSIILPPSPTGGCDETIKNLIEDSVLTKIQTKHLFTNHKHCQLS